MDPGSLMELETFKSKVWKRDARQDDHADFHSQDDQGDFQSYETIV